MRNSLSKAIAFVFLLVLVGLYAVPASAQAPLPVPAQEPPQPFPSQQGAPLPGQMPVPAAYPPAELDRIVSPIALYPDPLLAQVLTAATFYTEIPDAAQWADQHHYLTGPALAAAIQNDQVP